MTPRPNPPTHTERERPSKKAQGLKCAQRRPRNKVGTMKPKLTDLHCVFPVANSTTRFCRRCMFCIELGKGVYFLSWVLCIGYAFDVLSLGFRTQTVEWKALSPVNNALDVIT